MTDAATRVRGEWRTALDQMTADHAADQITVEVVDPEDGRGHEAERLPFSYINYDPKGDVVIIAVGGRDQRYPVVLRHMVYHPSGVDITEDRQAVRIVEPDGTITLVTFWATT
jgi:threonine dehydrogenase-like Zn-dependent dehydrogenase